MPASAAKIAANRQNALRSTGPRTVEGKERSRQNGLKHGMAGAGVVVVADDAVEVEVRHQALESELAPKSALGAILVRQLATLSVRMERGAKQEFASVAHRVRHATTDFDSERLDRVDQLYSCLAEDPRRVVRKLKESPEGVERLIEAWRELRYDLTRGSVGRWNTESREKAAHLSGLRLEDLPDSRLDALVRATGNCFVHLAESEHVGIAADVVKDWARTQLIERVDAEIAGLEAHRETLDHDAIAQDRAEAADRALFDPSREATLARRYESEARRGFFKALDQFRQAEAEAVERVKESTSEAPESSDLASSRENEPRPERDPRPASPLAARMVQSDEMVVVESRNRPNPIARTMVKAG